jgi:lysyl-tRNA synthetase class 2
VKPGEKDLDNQEQSRLVRIEANLRRRAVIYQLARAFFINQGFIEVETPVRMPAVAPEPYIVPFESEGWYLSTSPELHMKRLLASGYKKIFQMSRCFRKGEQGQKHNPEFTMLEWYRAGGDYLHMIHDTEQLFQAVARGLKQGDIIHYQGQKIDISSPWPRVTVRNAFQQAVGWDPVIENNPVKFDVDLVTKVIPGFAAGRPTVIFDYPAPMASLAKLSPIDSSVAQRAEVFIGGLELANAYSELIDAREQKDRFRENIERISREESRKANMPATFIDALDKMPECGGIALGMDRLVMLLCDAVSIGEVTAFTADTA